MMNRRELCPVCRVKLMNPAFSGCQMLVDGMMMRVCRDCYQAAFWKTNHARVHQRSIYF